MEMVSSMYMKNEGANLMRLLPVTRKRKKQKSIELFMGLREEDIFNNPLNESNSNIHVVSSEAELREISNKRINIDFVNFKLIMTQSPRSRFTEFYLVPQQARLLNKG